MPPRSNFFHFHAVLTQKKLPTSMHSSRMRTARLLTASPNMHSAEEGVCSRRGVSGPREGGSSPRGHGGVCSGEGVSQHAPRQTPPVNRMTDRCKNISLPQTSFVGGKNRLAHPPLKLPTLWEILGLLLLKHSRYPTDLGSNSYSAGNASKKNQNALFLNPKITIQTRMYSSRMRTARL